MNNLNNMNGKNSIIIKNVMRRVHFIYLGRKVWQKISDPKIIKLGLLALLLVLQSWFVSVPNVISNFGNSARSLNSLYAFTVAAFFNTQIIVQLLSVGIAIVGVLFVLDFVRKSRIAPQRLSWNA